MGELESKTQLDLALNLLNEERDVLKTWWVTITSTISAIIIGVFLSVFSGKMDEKYIAPVSILLAIIMPFLVIFLLEAFFRLEEVKRKKKRIIYTYIEAETTPNTPHVKFDQIKSLIDNDLPLRDSWRDFFGMLIAGNRFYFAIAASVLITLNVLGYYGEFAFNIWFGIFIFFSGSFFIIWGVVGYSYPAYLIDQWPDWK
jgi:Na+/melibiose symporter-like transporter